MTEEIGTYERHLYKKIESFIENKNIQLSQFWYSDRLCLPLQAISQMMIKIGLIPTQEQMSKLQKQVQFISLQNVIEGVKQWKQAEKNISTYLLKGSPKRIPKEQIIESPSVKSRTEQNWMNNSGIDKTQKFLVEHSQKQLRDKIKLNSTLRNVNNQSDYQISVKVGQANDICTKLKNSTQYVIDASKGFLQIIQKNKQGSIEISVKKFESKYQKLKLTIMNQVQEIQGNLQEDLKKILVEVMCLSGDMKKQIKLLQKKGIKH